MVIDTRKPCLTKGRGENVAVTIVNNSKAKQMFAHKNYGGNILCSRPNSTPIKPLQKTNDRPEYRFNL